MLPERDGPATDGPPSLAADVAGGVTTFLTMSYIVVVNPAILASPGTGMPFSGALTATVVVACGATLLMDPYAKLPSGWRCCRRSWRCCSPTSSSRRSRMACRPSSPSS